MLLDKIDLIQSNWTHFHEGIKGYLLILMNMVNKIFKEMKISTDL